MDSSGYAEAARNHIAALHISGVTVFVKPISFESHRASLGNLGDLVHSLINKEDTRINILHATPENYPRLLKKDKYNIGYAAWETDRLPKHWVSLVNQCNEVWVPSEHNVSMMERSGVTIPVFCMPHPFNHKYHEDAEIKSVIPDRNPEEFVFYSIFQWLERKNPAALLRAYLTEFTADEKVALILKTFVRNPGSVQERNKIRDMIRDIKAYLYLKSYPKVLLISSLLSREQILSLHKECDCYVSLHRCEGFGIPFVEAMLAKKPVIVTSYGGPEDFIKGSLEVDPAEVTGYPVPYQMTPVYGMPWPIYTGEMNWANPDIEVARRYMREVFEKRKLAKKVGEQGYNFVKKQFSWERVGVLMRARLEQIEGELNA
jgi:glycosyltransferase involved in cell wall biosynthesis